MAAAAKQSGAAKAIASLSSGLGASRLSPSVSALKVVTYKNPTQAGEKAFVKQVLPRLAYANPRLPIEVTTLASPTAPKASTGDSESSTPAESQNAVPPPASSGSQPTPSVTLEFENGLPPRKVQLSSKHTNKPASLITREILDLARFNDQAFDEQQSRSDAPGSASSQTPGETPIAPQPNSTNLAGSAEGISAGVSPSS
ncbi:unnamed protein product [Parajaminaea phylloscopi]